MKLSMHRGVTGTEASGAGPHSASLHSAIDRPPGTWPFGAGGVVPRESRIRGAGKSG